MQGQLYQLSGQPKRMVLPDGTESQSFRTHDRFIEAVIDHIKEPLLVSCIARQTDLLSATLWRFCLGKIDACEVCPINYTDSYQ
jgi:hypothetical protein